MYTCAYVYVLLVVMFVSFRGPDRWWLRIYDIVIEFILNICVHIVK